MNLIKTLFLLLLCLSILIFGINQSYAKEKKVYSYQKGILLDINTTLTTTTSYYGNTIPAGNISITTLNPSTSTKNNYFLTIKVNGLVYLVEHEYTVVHINPAGWIIGNPIYIRFNGAGNRIYIKNPQGKYIKELSCKILKVVKV